MPKKSALIALTATVALFASTAIPAFAGDPPKDGKCNSGRGNLTEGGGFGGFSADCDPGNSGAHNKGETVNPH